ncbi:hypothetical protein AALA80_05045 [Oscillospiraceae bacterium 50-60]
MNEEPTLLECVNRLHMMSLFPERFPGLTAEQIGQLRLALETINQAIEDVDSILWDRPEQNIEPPGMEFGG